MTIQTTSESGSSGSAAAAATDVPSQPFNIFDVLDIPHKERPHDNALAWLLDPRGGHGLADLAPRIVRHLWNDTVHAQAITVKQQFGLPGGHYPDIWVDLGDGVLMIENKVDVSALRPGQIADQNAAAKLLLKGRPLYHLLHRPDRVRSDGLTIEDSTFREMTYGQLASLLDDLALALADGTGRNIVIQFAQYVRSRYGRPMPGGIRSASGVTLACRYSRSGWSEDEFMEHVGKTCSPDVAKRQRELLDIVRNMEAVRVEFDAKGAVNPTYKVYLGDTTIHLLWVYADGRLYPTWKPLRIAGIDIGVAEWKRQWDNAIKAQNANDSFAAGGLATFSPAEVAEKLQRIADFITEKKSGADSDSKRNTSE